MSCNRPSASYPEQFNQSKSVKADKSQKVTDSTSSKPVSSAVPKKKADTKKISTKNKKSAPIKEYMPSDSRNGAGKAFYRKKTTPSGAKEGVSFLISAVPEVGDAKDIQEVITGKDWITGRKLSKTDRLTTAASACIPIISGSSVRVARNGIKYGNKATKKTVKKAVRKGSSKFEKSTKTAKKAIGKVTKKSDDVRKKAVGKLKKSTKEIEKSNTGKKVVKESEENAKIKESGVKKKEKAAGKVHKDGVVSKGSNKTTKPKQIHHYATNKSKTYTPQLEEIANKYGLDLDDVWNKELLLHQGRHPNAYHNYVLDSMKQFDEIAQGDKDIFLKLFENLKNNVKSNPDMLYKDYWN